MIVTLLSFLQQKESPGPYTPLDVDAGRIVASGENETRVLGPDGAILLSLPVPTLAAQLSGSDLLLAAGGQLRVYDAGTGAPRSAWPLPAPAGHDCDLHGDPTASTRRRSPSRTLLAASPSTFLDGQVRSGRLAPPVRVGKHRRWRRGDVAALVARGDATGANGTHGRGGGQAGG